MKLSLIINVLESYIPVKRYLTYLNKKKHPYFEFILVDDGSNPSILSRCSNEINKQVNRFVYKQTNDERKWTMPCARNRGAELSKAEYLLFTDMDHIITHEAIEECLQSTHDKQNFKREWGILDETGNIITEVPVLQEYGLQQHNPGHHCNTFLIKRKIFNQLKYDETKIGRSGPGDDVDFNKRYGELHRQGKAQRHVTAKSKIYVYPNPKRDVKRIFHGLR